MDIIRLNEIDSTNSWAILNWGDVNKPAMVYAVSQNKGRGQRGNSWESEAGMNVTASFVFVPKGVLPCGQFVISEAVALGVIDFLRDNGIEASVKWPNDIYVGDKKICGILIENAVLGKEITRTVAGIGLNVNQELFLSDAPNPVSMRQITKKMYDIDDSVRQLAEKIASRIKNLTDVDSMAREYRDTLWRGDGAYYPFRDKKQDCDIFARILNIGRDGILTLETSEGKCHEYAFKEVEFLLDFS